jgi:hypothetical protein
MRGYSVAATALALDVEPKWLDNLLSQHRVPGVSQSRQGVQRRLAPGAVYRIATIHSLNRDVQLPVAAAVRLAEALWEAPSEAGVPDHASARIGEITVVLPRSDIRARVDAALADALEAAPRKRRGRPRG